MVVIMLQSCECLVYRSERVKDCLWLDIFNTLLEHLSYIYVSAFPTRWMCSFASKQPDPSPWEAKILSNRFSLVFQVRLPFVLPPSNNFDHYFQFQLLSSTNPLFPFHRNVLDWHRKNTDHSRKGENRSCVSAKSLQSCPTLCDPMKCSLAGSSVHGILQARILEWVSMPSSRGYSQLTQGLSPLLLCLVH